MGGSGLVIRRQVGGLRVRLPPSPPRPAAAIAARSLRSPPPPRAVLGVVGEGADGPLDTACPPPGVPATAPSSPSHPPPPPLCRAEGRVGADAPRRPRRVGEVAVAVVTLPQSLLRSRVGVEGEEGEVVTSPSLVPSLPPPPRSPPSHPCCFTTHRCCPSLRRPRWRRSSSTYSACCFSSSRRRWQLRPRLGVGGPSPASPVVGATVVAAAVGAATR